MASTEHKYTVHFVRDGNDYELDVEFSYSPGTPDVWYLPNGDPGYPGDPAEIEINKASYVNEQGVRIVPELSEDEYEAVYNSLMDSFIEWGPEDYDPREEFQEPEYD